MPYEQFLQWDSGDRHFEWVNGEVVPMAAVSNEHADVNGFLEALIRLFAERHKLGEVRSAPFNMKLACSGRAPDVLFVARRNLAQMRTSHLEGPADLAVEIISPKGDRLDRVDKFREYQEGRVREY